MTSDDGSYVSRLRKLDACAVSDALDRLRLSGVVTHLHGYSGPGSFAGIAVTVKLGTGEPPPGQSRHLGTTAIEASNADSVIVIEQRTGVEAGCWGGLLTLAATVREVAGVIADGPVRDIDEARELGFPIQARSTTSYTARSRIVEKATNVPVTIGEVTVSPGDFVIADGSAAIFVSPDNIAEVLDVAEDISVREARMAAAIKLGKPVSAVLSGDYEKMLSDST